MTALAYIHQARPDSCVAACTAMIYRHLGHRQDEAFFIQRWMGDAFGVDWTRPVTDRALPVRFAAYSVDQSPAQLELLKAALLHRQTLAIAVVSGAGWHCIAQLHAPPLTSPHGALFGGFGPADDLLDTLRHIDRRGPASRDHVILLSGYHPLRGFEVFDPYHPEPPPPVWIDEDRFICAWSGRWLQPTSGLLHVKESSGVRRKRAKEAGERGIDIQRGYLERANHAHPHLLLRHRRPPLLQLRPSSYQHPLYLTRRHDLRRR